MGLLDDAIREHLELKRRRGADPAEVERAEREALGPVRRSPDGPEELEYADETPLADHELGYDDEVTPGWDDTRLEAYPEEQHGLPSDPRPADPSPAPPPVHDRAWEEEQAALGGQPSPQPPSHAPFPADPSPAAPPPHVPEDTAEYDVELEHRTGHPHDEDVLEETPEFLQDTPDHDRLWFEQRPPRDFDFDS